MTLIKPTVFVRPGQSWNVEIAPWSAALTIPNGSNSVAVKSALDLLTYTNVWDFQEFAITGVRDNEQEYLSDRCGIGTVCGLMSR